MEEFGRVKVSSNSVNLESNFSFVLTVFNVLRSFSELDITYG